MLIQQMLRNYISLLSQTSQKQSLFVFESQLFCFVFVEQNVQYIYFKLIIMVQAFVSMKIIKNIVKCIFKARRAFQLFQLFITVIGNDEYQIKIVMSLLDFQVLGKVGQSDTSKVMKVRRVLDGSIYALKQVKVEGQSPKQTEKAINEVRVLASIRHPNVIAYKEAFYDSSSRSLCIIMEYADGGDLLQKIFEYKRKGDQLPEDYIWDIFIQILRGLSTLHDLHVAHRDLKSANIFLTRNGLAKIGDFRVATILRKGDLCQTQTGTPYYASPQVWRNEPYDSKSDIWSLGCILFQLIHLKPPFRARDLEGLSKKVTQGYFGKVSRYYSNEFSELLTHMLEPDPFLRYNCRDLLHHPIVKSKLKTAKEIINLEPPSNLLATIKPVKNMNYLTDRLPKPNYTPIRFKASRQVSTSAVFEKKMIKGASQIFPKVQKSLELSKSQRSYSSLQKGKKVTAVVDPQLPSIKVKNRRY